MNLEKLKQLESIFLLRYPQGFEDPELMVISKKHKVEELKEFVHHNFAKEKFDDPSSISADVDNGAFCGFLMITIE